jgi:hypothetical protein
MQQSLVLARLRPLPSLVFSVSTLLALAGVVPLGAGSAGPGLSAYAVFYLLIVAAGLLYAGFNLIAVASCILLSRSTALYIDRGRVIYLVPFLFSVPLSDIREVDVDRQREHLPFLKATVRIRRRKGRTRYVRTEFLDRTADEIATALIAELADRAFG